MLFKHGPLTVAEGKIRVITFLGFLFGFSVSLMVYLTSSYFNDAIGADYVGFAYVVSSIIILVILLNLHKVFALFGRGRTLLFMLLAQIVILAGLIAAPVDLTGAILLMCYTIMYGVIYVLWDVILEAYSDDNDTGSVRGMFLSVWALGSIIAPIIATTLVASYGYHAIFIILLFLYVTMFLLVLIALRNIRGHASRTHESVWSLLKRVGSNRDIWHIYWVALSLRLFYAVMTIFMPLYLLSIGFDWKQIGFMFTIMILPFVLFQYPAGVLADKKYGEKEMLFIGFILIIVSVTVMAFTSSQSFVFWSIILFISI